MRSRKTTGHNIVWHMRYGAWWMVQWCRDGWYSFGVHIETKRRIALTNGLRRPYGPYIDFHFLWFILSLGVNPVYSGELECSTSVSRGGIRAGGN